MSISRASGVGEIKRHFVIAIDSFEEGKVSGVVYHITYPQALIFESLIDLVWIVEAVSDELCWPVSLTKQRNFKLLLPVSRQLTKDNGICKVRRGNLATLKLKLNHRNNASWQGIAAWVEKEETKGFKSFLELNRYIGRIVDPRDDMSTPLNCPVTGSICIDDNQQGCLRGSIRSLGRHEMSGFHSILGLSRSFDAMMAVWELEGLPLGSSEVEMLASKTKSGRAANFTVRIRFCEYGTWQGTIDWQEMRQTVHFRSFLELIKLMDLAVLNSKKIAAGH